MSKANDAGPIGSQVLEAALKDSRTLSGVDTEWLEVIEKPYPAYDL